MLPRAANGAANGHFPPGAGSIGSAESPGSAELIPTIPLSDIAVPVTDIVCPPTENIKSNDTC